MKPRVILVDLSGRHSYIEPCIMNKSEMLARFYTGIYLRRRAAMIGLRVASLISFNFKGLERLLRRTSDLPSERVVSLWGVELRAKTRRLLRVPGLVSSLAVAKEFCSKVAAMLPTEEANAICCIPGCWEIFKAAKSVGMKCIIDQNIATWEVEQQIMRDERERWPGWEPTAEMSAGEAQILERRIKARQYADAVFCPSQFVRNSLKGLMPEGVKRITLPYCPRIQNHFRQPKNYSGSRALRVLFVGSVGLQKGIPYLLKAAKLLGRAVELRAVGPYRIVPDKLHSVVNEQIEFTGSIPFRKITDQYKWADVFCLPSLCEGSALVTYEALASGLPVVCTESTGSVITDGTDGFIIPVRSSEAIADALSRFVDEPDLITVMSEKALLKASRFTWKHYEHVLLQAYAEALS